MTANGGSKKEKEPSELDEVDLSKLKLVSSLVGRVPYFDSLALLAVFRWFPTLDQRCGSRMICESDMIGE